MNVTVQVTQSHIDHGERATCSSCPVALALKDVLTHGWMPYVGDYSIRIYDLLRVDVCGGLSDCHLELFTPKEATDFIHKFDDRRAVDPFSFKLELPWYFIRKEVLDKGLFGK
jgi:hypothetical protein